MLLDVLSSTLFRRFLSLALSLRRKDGGSEAQRARHAGTATGRVLPCARAGGALSRLWRRCPKGSRVSRIAPHKGQGGRPVSLRGPWRLAVNFGRSAVRTATGRLAPKASSPRRCRRKGTSCRPSPDATASASTQAWLSAATPPSSLWKPDPEKRAGWRVSTIRDTRVRWPQAGWPEAALTLYRRWNAICLGAWF